MTRNNAREIAVHLVFGLEFGARSAEEVLKSELSRERFEALGQESPLYAQYPNEKQREYIRALVEGVYAHGEELDAYISRYAVGWSLSRIPRMARAWESLPAHPKEMPCKDGTQDGMEGIREFLS